MQAVFFFFIVKPHSAAAALNELEHTRTGTASRDMRPKTKDSSKVHIVRGDEAEEAQLVPPRSITDIVNP
ncbi:hypothetical protein NL676_033450 [Syzygium grande]|nr:hypothetical protein NL676_033450 [Syzygium grande]